jgi:hypothetical protein
MIKVFIKGDFFFSHNARNIQWERKSKAEYFVCALPTKAIEGDESRARTPCRVPHCGDQGNGGKIPIHFSRI